MFQTEAINQTIQTNLSLTETLLQMSNGTFVTQTLAFVDVIEAVKV